MAILRGLLEKHEQNPGLLIRDTRTFGQRFVDFFKNPLYATITMGMLTVSAFFFSPVADFILVFAIIIFIYAITRKQKLPFRLPQNAKTKDYNDTLPGSNKPRMSRGIFFLGNDAQNNEELWFNNEDMRTHMLIFGSTGSGKTEALLSLSYNALVQGSGLIYVDGKGDNSLFTKVFSMARSMGREDDVLLINFMTGARDVIGPQENRLSNTMNPFSDGSSSMLSQLVISLMDGSSQSPDGDMWKGRAIGFVEALMRLLVYMRDQGKILLDANTVRQYFTLDKLESIDSDKLFPRDGQEPVSLEDAPQVILEPIKSYMDNLPGYNRKNKGKQVSQVLEQHGFITMQLTRVFTSLADTYGHIIRTNLPEVDFKDVVLNRRILVVLLPALEKSPDELSNLGKVIIASLKAMMASGLGDNVEGDYADIIEKKPTNAATPFLCVLDEYGYYAVEGFSVVPAQARSLGFSAIFAGQDLPAFQKASKEEAMSIGANTNIKICMKLEDPTETWEFFSKTAGESYVTKVDSFQTSQQSIMNNYLDTRSASAEKRARIDLLDMKEQGVGEAHIFFKSKIVRAKFFFADPKPVKKIRLNHFLKVDKPPTRRLVDLQRRSESFAKALEKTDLFANVDLQDQDIQMVADQMLVHRDKGQIESGVATLLAMHDGTHEPVEPEVPVEEIEYSDDLNVFTRAQPTDLVRQLATAEELPLFVGGLLKKHDITPQVAFVERMSGKNEKHAVAISNELLKDIETTTQYPPQIHEIPDVQEYCLIAEELAKFVVDQKNNPAEGGDNKD